ncbi:uncharacterized protein B0I36DRAFT_370071 [Microdochium trichocladiopsis]|uniref:Uncharacterized protein n=1 Tax=Microdochium trichocladiopsis TaxID=1682393 RepID=A0A9P9BFA0_9PEZI|nr:uncharacterized protein B0I36DRAFT_370071 [Microdochium trichocladiopsis]KAH7010771.1 hypothetical protein B0I36DRAFT_370071 [Microdochium trichocladiopsis]
MSGPRLKANLLSLPAEIRLSIGNYMLEGQREIELSQTGGRTSNTWEAATGEHYGLDTQRITDIHNMKFLGNVLTAGGPLSVLRHCFSSFDDVYLFLSAHRPAALTQIRYLVVHWSWLPPVGEMQAMLAGTGPVPHPRDVGVSINGRGQHDHILALLSHASRLKRFALRIDMTNHYDSIGAFDQNVTETVLLEAFTSIENIFFHTPDEDDGTDMSTVTRLINLPGFRLEFCMCTYDDSTMNLVEHQIVDVATLEGGLPVNFGADLPSHAFWTSRETRKRVKELSVEIYRRQLRHARLPRPPLPATSGTARMKAAYDASGLTVSGLYKDVQWLDRPDQPPSSRTRRCSKLTRHNTIARHAAQLVDPTDGLIKQFIKVQVIYQSGGNIMAAVRRWSGNDEQHVPLSALMGDEGLDALHDFLASPAADLQVIFSAVNPVKLLEELGSCDCRRSRALKRVQRILRTAATAQSCRPIIRGPRGVDEHTARPSRILDCWMSC